MHEHVTNALQVISTAWFKALVHVEAGVTNCACHTPLSSARDMLTCLRVAESLCKAEVHYVDSVAPGSNAHQEIVGLDVAVDDAACVDKLDTINHLHCKQHYCPDAELAAT